MHSNGTTPVKHAAEAFERKAPAGPPLGRLGTARYCQIAHVMY